MNEKDIKRKSRKVIKEIRYNAEIENRPINDKASIEMMYSMLRNTITRKS